MVDIDETHQSVSVAPKILEDFVLKWESLGRRPRIAFVAGPGDIVASFDFWSVGKHDLRVPIISYAVQLFTVIDALDADVLVLHEHASKPSNVRPRFEFVSMERSRNHLGIRYWVNELLHGIRLLRILTDWRPDFVVLAGDMAISAYLPLSLRFQVFLTIHNSFWPMGVDGQSFRLKSKIFLWRLAFRNIAGAICTSRECARQLKRILRGKNLPILVETPQLLARHLSPVSSRMTARNFIFVGRIDKVKGVFDLLEAFQSCASCVSGASLNFAGTGPGVAELERRIASYSGPGDVAFLGRLDANGVHEALQRHDVLVCPTRTSFKEGLALVVLEAAAHGLPTIASSVVPAAQDSNGSSIVFPADNVEELSKSMKHLMLNSDAYAELSAKAYGIRNRILDRSLSWGSCLLRLISGQTTDCLPDRSATQMSETPR